MSKSQKDIEREEIKCQTEAYLATGKRIKKLKPVKIDQIGSRAVDYEYNPVFDQINTSEL